MNVANVLFDERHGGGHKRIVQVAKRLETHKIHTIIYFPEKRAVEQTLAEQAGLAVSHVAFRRIPRLANLFQVLIWFFLLPRDIFLFATLFRKDQIDIVHVNGAFFFAPAFAAKLCRIPLVWHLNDTIVPKRISWMFGYIVKAFANSVVVAAKAVAQHYAIPASKTTVIYAPVDTSTPVVDPERSGKTFRIGLVANWTRVKGIEYFIRAAAKVREEVKMPLEAVIAGAKLESQAEYLDKLLSIIEELNLGDVIQNLGFVKDTRSLIGSLDVLVLSSVTEACPIVVLEAMSVGVPVVGTNVGGVKELLEPDSSNPSGIVVASRDVDAIANAVITLSQAPERRKKMGLAGREAVSHHFSLEKCVERHIRLYRALYNDDNQQGHTH